MVSRKRTRSEADAAPQQPPEEPSLLGRLRNCWEFANLMQYIAIFGKLMKIDEDFGIDVRAPFAALYAPAAQSGKRLAMALRIGSPFRLNLTWLLHLGPRERMPETRIVGKAAGDRAVSAQMGLVASRPDVRARFLRSLRPR